MTGRYPAIEPYEQGMLDVGDGNTVHWETSGNPDGKPAVVLHGGPGSGSSPGTRRLFDPSAYRIVQFDQRNCGRSTPHAADPATDLGHNTTAHLVGDIELLRDHLGVDRWLVWGASWGSTLALAYAEAHPDRVTEMSLVGVTTGRHEEVDWVFRGGIARLFPQQFEQLLAGLPAGLRDADVVEGYHRLLNDADPSVCAAAAEAWCRWESATPAWPPTAGMDDRFADPAYALAFARIVTHYARSYCWLEDGALLRDAGLLADIPGVLVNGRFDFQAPIANAWALHRAWPRAELVIVDDAGHHSNDALVDAMVRATDRFAARA
jgi:proline iminopeptidase